MWIVFGLVSAISDAAKNIFAKKSSQHFDPLVITWAWVFYSMFVFLPLMVTKIPARLDVIFWQSFILRILLDSFAFILFSKAIQKSDLSMSLPMLTFTPVFTLFTGMLINREFPNTLESVGMIMIVFGAYILNLKNTRKNIWQPILSIYEDKGTLIMFIVACIWGITTSLHKLAILHSNPYFYAGLSSLALTTVFTPLAIIKNKKDFQRAISLKNLPSLLPIGLLDGVTTLTLFLSQNLAFSVLAISLKRTSIFFSAIFGWLFFKEKIKNRLIPIIVMIGGVILITLP